jgi:hypothetical protein
MVRTELIKRSPLRILEKSIHGGLGKGNLAIIASPKGIGKTACLVHIATDTLLMGKHIIHVSFSARTDHIISWYEDIFKEIARKRELESAMEVHDEIIRNRVIMNFNQEAIKTEQVVKSLKAMILDGNFTADQIVVDGYDFSRSSPEEFKVIKDFAVELGTSIWFSSSTLADDLEGRANGVPKSLEPYMDYVSVLITLADKQDHINLRLVKDHGTYTKEDLDIRLDPRTLLIAEDI